MSDEQITTESFVKSLRMIADFYEQNPQVKLPYMGAVSEQKQMDIFDYEDTKAGIAQAMRDIAPCEKQVDETFFKLKRSFGCIDLIVSVYREKVCEQVVIGTKEQIVKVPIAFKEETQTVKVPTEFEDRIETIEIKEWRCPESLLKGEAA